MSNPTGNEVQETIKSAVKNHLKIKTKVDHDGYLRITLYWDDEEIDRDYAPILNPERCI